jgi:hypothetical protein
MNIIKNKGNSIFLFILFIIFTTSSLVTGFWVAQDCASDQQLIFEPEKGTFLGFRPEFSVFDLHGNLYSQGVFKKTNGDLIELEDTVQLDDGTFFSLAFLYGNNNIVDQYKVIRFTRDAQVLWAKELILDTSTYSLRQVIQVGTTLKVIGEHHNSMGDSSIIIINLSEAGNLLGSKTRKIIGSGFYQPNSQITCFKTTASSYGLLQRGFRTSGNNDYRSFILTKLTEKDEIKISKLYYYPTPSPNYQFEYPVILKKSNNHLTILIYTVSNDQSSNSQANLLNLNSNWDTTWAKTYQFPAVPSNKLNAFHPHMKETSNGLIIGLNSNANESANTSNPILLRTDANGNPTWAKMYDYAGYWGMFSLQYLPHDGFLMGTNYRYFYMVDKNGEVPNGCSVYQNLTVKTETLPLNQEAFSINNYEWSTLSVPIKNIDAAYHEVQTCDGFIGDPYCQYTTLDGDFTSFTNSSLLFTNYYHHIEFTADTTILPYITEFKIYRKQGDEDYQLITTIPKEENKTDYQITFPPLISGSPSYSYKIMATNSQNHVVDFLILR